MIRSTFSTLSALVVLGAALAGCSPVVATRGHLAEQERLAEIKQGTSTRDDVLGTLGTPTQVGTFDPNTWYYIGQKTEKVAFFEPEVVERKVVILRFDERGVVKEMSMLDATAGQDVELVDRSTPTSGREMGFLEQLLGNLGRFNAGQKPTVSPGR